MQKIIKLKLRVLARLVLRKYQPDIIAITGSVGKSLVREAIFAVLESKYKIRKSFKNDHSLGVLGAIFTSNFETKSVWSWSSIFFRALGLILFRDKNYPQILVLEMGADRPGDIEILRRIAPPRISIITTIEDAHLKFYGSREKIAKEKSQLITKLKKDNWAIINRDDELAYNLVSKTRAKVLTYGFHEEALLRASEVHSKWEDGVNFKLTYQGSTVPILLPRVLGEKQIYGALIAAAVGIIYDLNLVEISENLKKYESPPGRLKLIKGIKNTLIIDDSFNASPETVAVALAIIKDFNLTQKFSHRRKKFVVLGDMLELGHYTQTEYEEIGKKVAESGIQVLVTVGESAKYIAETAKKKGLSEDQIFEFDHVEEAGIFIQDRLKEGDLILIKGSPKMQMEKVVKELMAEPLRAGELLARQGEM